MKSKWSAADGVVLSVVTDCGVMCLQHSQRDIKSSEAPAAGSAAAQPQGPYRLWLVNIKHCEINEVRDCVVFMQTYTDDLNSTFSCTWGNNNSKCKK